MFIIKVKISNMIQFRLLGISEINPILYIIY